MTPSSTALIAGATGVVGRMLVRQLADDPAWSSICALVRRESADIGSATRVRQQLTDYETLAAGTLELPSATHAFCCLGTTRRAAGSDAAFRRVDFDYCLAFARAAQRAGARHILLVSAVGASATSSVLYSRTKGEVEQAIIGLGFRSTTIVRPSFLDGDRVESRPLEQVGIVLGRLFPLAWRSVPVSAVAAAMIEAARHDRPGVQWIENAELLQPERRAAVRGGA